MPPLWRDFHRAGELTAIWVPDPGHEAIRDLVRAREAAMEDLRAKRQHLQSFLLRHGRIYPGLRSWTLVHARWLSSLTFEHSAQYLVLREYRPLKMPSHGLSAPDAASRRRCLHLVNGAGGPGLPGYAWCGGLRSPLWRKLAMCAAFETPRQLMAYLGLVPSERSTGEQVRAR